MGADNEGTQQDEFHPLKEGRTMKRCAPLGGGPVRSRYRNKPLLSR